MSYRSRAGLHRSRRSSTFANASASPARYESYGSFGIPPERRAVWKNSANAGYPRRCSYLLMPGSRIRALNLEDVVGFDHHPQARPQRESDALCETRILWLLTLDLYAVPRMEARA